MNKKLIATEIIINTVDFEIIVPDAENFIQQFKKKFPEIQGSINSTIKNYYAVANGVRVNVEIAKRDKGQFITFLRSYSRANDLSYKPKVESAN